MISRRCPRLLNNIISGFSFEVVSCVIVSIAFNLSLAVSNLASAATNLASSASSLDSPDEKDLKLSNNSYKIVSLNPTLTEILFAMGLGTSIVGTTDFSDYPEQAKNIERVGSYMKPNVEKIIALKPTHVIGFREGVDTFSAVIKKTKIPFLILESRTLVDYRQIIEKLGDTFDRKENSKMLWVAWNTMWGQVPSFSGGKKALMLVEWDPLIVAGSDAFLSESMEKCGLKNVVNDKGYPRLNRETLEALNPEVIVFAGHEGNEKQFEEAKISFKKSPRLKHSLFYNNKNEALGRLGPRLPQAVKDLCGALIAAKN